ncbi:hypothetical protein SAMN05518801_101350 [Novosphingobium sp. CF614]|uniref:DUF6519 domain-containing protein n=1 Tax=Novosphingobium sp. CF614 TaxID=1884364 RepID=UPI0008EEDAE3|nr:DUF6519 domain-containing protein [Novosphingobium sp. CF614]SFF76516.1 hypothetical protein SAMN05518801_101350 [Novosphingobium sp. CF614]
MKGDFSRLRFDPTRQYDAVLLQQGRVALDADANEAAVIALDRDRRTSADVIGKVGAPQDTPGFGISVEPAGKLGVGAGTLYVDGIRCINPAKYLHDAQPYLPAGAPVFVAPDGTLSAAPADGRYIGFVDVWHRHVTALEDDALMEEALGVDTATRLQVIEQVRFLRAGNAGDAAITCDAAVPAWNTLVTPPDGTMAARGKPADAEANPCAFPETAGYQRLENHLYRVEIHKSGTVASGATFKWSRDNAAFATRWLESNGDTLTLADTGRDAQSGLKPGQWIELTDDDKELSGRPGTLVRILSLIGTRVRLDTPTADGPIAIAQFGRNPKVRAWDSPGAVAITVPAGNDGFLPLESGLEVLFAAGRKYRSGDWWVVPARSGSGIDWPEAGGVPQAKPPCGVEHSYARLAVLDRVAGVWTLIGDCRPLFPPLTAMKQLAMLGGDGQEALPDPTQPALLCPLADPLRVGVFRGTTPVAGARVRFRILTGGGKLDPVLPSGGATSVIRVTDPQGEATAPWALDATTPTQQVRAELLDSTNTPIGLAVTFGASLSTAAHVSFDPAPAPSLAGIVTVQRAIEELAKRVGGGCVEVTLSPGTDWGKILRDLPKGEDATICFRQGDFTTDEPVVIEGLGHVVIHGGGAATRVTGTKNERVLEFLDCASLTMRDLTIAAVQDFHEHLEHRGGALTVTGCPVVSLENLVVTCGASLGNERTCVTVRGGDNDGQTVPVEHVEVSGCRFVAGFGQGGLLVTDAIDSVIRDNSLAVAPLPSTISFEELATDPERMGLLARQLARDFAPADAVSTAPAGSVIVGNYAISMASMVDTKDWQTLIAANPPAEAEARSVDGVQSYMKRITDKALSETSDTSGTARAFTSSASQMRKVMGRQTGFEMSSELLGDLIRGGDMQVVEVPGGANAAGGRIVIPVGQWRVSFESEIGQEAWTQIARTHVEELTAQSEQEAEEAIDRLVKRFVTDAELRKTSPAVSAWFNDLKKNLGVVGAQAIVVAGSLGRMTRIERNEADHFLEGVHVALARRGDGAGDHVDFGSIAVIANRLRLRLPVEYLWGGHGIYVGNAARVRVNDNEIDMATGDPQALRFHEGIRIWGYLGNFVHVLANAITLARVGIRVVAEREPQDYKSLQWLAADNLAVDASTTVDAPEWMRLRDNAP